MTVLAPEIDFTPPPLYHRHEWRVFDAIGENDLCAFCADCDATMTREQVEAILNGHALAQIDYLRATDE